MLLDRKSLVLIYIAGQNVVQDSSASHLIFIPTLGAQRTVEARSLGTRSLSSTGVPTEQWFLDG